MTRLGQAWYCDECGGEIMPGGTHCTECDPKHGIKEISFTFIIVLPETEDTQEEQQPRRKFLGLF